MSTWCSSHSLGSSDKCMKTLAPIAVTGLDPAANKSQILILVGMFNYKQNKNLFWL